MASCGIIDSREKTLGCCEILRECLAVHPLNMYMITWETPCENPTKIYLNIPKNFLISGSLDLFVADLVLVYEIST